MQVAFRLPAVVCIIRFRIFWCLFRIPVGRRMDKTATSSSLERETSRHDCRTGSWRLGCVATLNVADAEKRRNQNFWKWVVLGASFVCNLLVTGIAFSYGVFYVTFIDEFQQSRSRTAAAGSINIGVMFGIGPFAGVLQRKFGSQFIAIVGGIISAAGIFASSFVTSLHHLYGTYGIVTGIGFGLINLSAIVSVNLHFKKQRGLASAVSVSGCGVGSLAFPLLVNSLIRQLGWRQTFLAISGVQLLTVVCGALMVPIEREAKTSKLPSPTPEGTRPCDLALFRNVKYTVFVISCLLSATGAGVPTIIITDYARTNGAGAGGSALLVSAIGIAGTFGRLAAGLTSSWKKINVLLFYIISMVLSGVGTALCPLDGQYWLTMLSAATFGLFYGVCAGLDPVVIADLVGLDRLAVAYGCFSLSLGIGSLISSPIAGYLQKIVGNYSISFYLAGVFMVMAAALLTPVLFHLRLRKTEMKELRESSIIELLAYRPLH